MIHRLDHPANSVLQVLVGIMNQSGAPKSIRDGEEPVHKGPPDRVRRCREYPKSFGTWGFVVSAFVLKIKQIFFGHFDPDFFFKIMKMNNFRGDLTDISVKKNCSLCRGV